MGDPIPFSARLLNSLPLPESGREDWRDQQTPGLYLRVTATGTKTFCWLRRVNGRLERMTLGRWPEMSIEDARRHATRMNMAAMEGDNPAEQRRAAQAEMIFSELFAVYLERWAKVRKKTWREDESKFNLHLKPLHQKRLSTITRADVARIHTDIGTKQPAFANRVLALVSKVFNSATEFGLWSGSNPAKGIRHFREESRDRFLSGDELQRFLAALSEESEPLRSYFLLALLTGARRSNVLSMRWDQIDMEHAMWRIPDTKNGMPVTVPLVPMAVEILQGLESDSEWVFPSPRGSTTGHMVELRRSWERILARAGIENARIHDLRRTMGSWQAITGASLPIIGKSLGHASQQATAIYARLNLDPVRASMEKAADAMLGKR